MHCVKGWNLSALTTASPSFSCRKEQKKVRERERKEVLCQVTHPRRPANGLRSITAHSYCRKVRLRGGRQKYFGSAIMATPQFQQEHCFMSAWPRVSLRISHQMEATETKIHDVAVETDSLNPLCPCIVGQQTGATSHSNFPFLIFCRTDLGLLFHTAVS